MFLLLNSFVKNTIPKERLKGIKPKKWSRSFIGQQGPFSTPNQAQYNYMASKTRTAYFRVFDPETIYDVVGNYSTLLSFKKKPHLITLGPISIPFENYMELDSFAYGSDNWT